MSRFFITTVLPIIALAMGVLGFVHVQRASQPVPALSPPTAPVRSPYAATIAASGIVEPKHESIAIGTALSGIVLEVFVPSESVGQQVKQGDSLFRVDDRHLKAQLTLHQANLASAQATFLKLEALPREESLPPVQARVKAMEAQRSRLFDQFQRSQKLLTTKAITEEELTQRRLSYEEADQQWSEAKSEFDLLKAGTWQPDRDVAKAAVAIAAAQVQQIQIEIDRALVRAPTDGEVLQVNVRPGQAVSAQSGQALIMLGDSSELRIRVDIDEHDIPRFHKAASARGFLRGDAQHELTLHFIRLEPFVIPKKSLTGDNKERVDTRVLQAIYSLDAAANAVFVGQQLDVFLDAGS
jgi:multidrug efflux pump subunit AcrA (membrane-fusion protein)